MNMERIYEVKITEYLQKTVRVKATSERQARLAAEADWQAANIILYPEDSKGADFYVIGEAPEGSQEDLNYEDYK